MAPEVIVGAGVELTDPHLKALGDRVANTVRAAGEKAIGNVADPRRFPLPAEPDSLERIVRRFYDRQPAGPRRAALQRVMASLVAPRAQRQTELGPLADIELGSRTPVELLAGSVDGLRDLSWLAPPAHSAAAPAAAAAAGALNKTVALRLRRVECKDETGIEIPFIGEPGSDEIELGGTSVDETGDTLTVPRISVGTFDDGDRKGFTPPRRITFFNVREGKVFPKLYQVALVLSERDAGGLAEFLDQLTDKVRDFVEAKLNQILTTGTPIDEYLRKVVAYVVDKVFGWLKSLWGDDLFTPIIVHCTMNTPTGRFKNGTSLQSDEHRLVYEGHHGEYHVFYDWLIGR
jgi:hypothetical protein